MNDKEKKAIFDEDMGNVNLPLHSIMDMGSITDPTLIALNNLYGKVNALSVENANRYRKIIKALSVIGAILAGSFLFYDEAELHWLIIVCTVCLIIFYLIISQADKLDCHRKYVEYRVLAESIRVQFFLTFAGIKEPVTELLPYFIQINLKWVKDELSALDLSQTNEKRPILDYWINNQRQYHYNAINRDKPRYQKEQKIQKYALIVTIIVYAFTLVVEFFIYCNCLNGFDINHIRALLKIAIGIPAVITLFAVNYYGKLSLSDNIRDSESMVILYDKVKEEIDRNNGEESEEIIRYLAKEFLIENSAWYNYHSRNNPDWVM